MKWSSYNYLVDTLGISAKKSQSTFSIVNLFSLLPRKFALDVAIIYFTRLFEKSGSILK